MRNKLPTLRKNQGLSQNDLAVLLGVSRQTINAIEKAVMTRVCLWHSNYQDSLN